MEKQEICKLTESETKMKDDDILMMYSGPVHRKLKERDPNYLRYIEILYLKIEKFSNKSQKHSIGFCSSCICFITLQGVQRAELGHPTEDLITAKKLFKQEGISNLSTLIEWNKRTVCKVRQKGREIQMKIVPVINRYHIMTDFDNLISQKDRRSYVMNLEEKIRKLEAENGVLRKRLLVAHMNEFYTPGVNPQNEYE